jgi:hypothetical protein
VDHRLGFGSRLRVSNLLALAFVVVSTGCGSLRQSTAPTQHGEPLPGSYHLISDPTLAPYDIVIREADSGGSHSLSEHFSQGQKVELTWSTLPLPSPKWIQVNGQNCEGSFTIEPRVETDLLLLLTTDSCQLQVLAKHPEGTGH